MGKTMTMRKSSGPIFEKIIILSSLPTSILNDLSSNLFKKIALYSIRGYLNYSKSSDDHEIISPDDLNAFEIVIVLNVPTFPPQNKDIDARIGNIIFGKMGVGSRYQQDGDVKKLSDPEGYITVILPVRRTVQNTHGYRKSAMMLNPEEHLCVYSYPNLLQTIFPEVKSLEFELEEAANSLAELTKRSLIVGNSDPDEWHEIRDEVRTIGKFINENGGFDLMQKVFKRHGQLGGHGRSLEVMWNNIGSWLG
jgi:hypothetical protein